MPVGTMPVGAIVIGGIIPLGAMVIGGTIPLGAIPTPIGIPVGVMPMSSICDGAITTGAGVIGISG